MLSDYRAAHSKVHACIFIYLERERRQTLDQRIAPKHLNVHYAVKIDRNGSHSEFRWFCIMVEWSQWKTDGEWSCRDECSLISQQWIAMKSRSIRQTITHISNHGLNQKYVKCVKKQLKWGKKHEVNKYRTEQNKSRNKTEKTSAQIHA